MTVLSIVQSLGATSPASGPVVFYVRHDPIVIVGNAGFVPENGVASGSGTESDPYIIEGWEFDSVAGRGIDIESTDAHVVIRGNSIHETSWSGGIELWYCANVDIENNMIYDNYQNGIFLFGVQDVSVTSNNISENQRGIVIVTSRNVTMEDNNLYHDTIDLGWSWSVSDLSSHTISTSNLVNGNPVYYHKDTAGLIIDGISAGELIIVNCSDVEVANVESSTIFLAYVNNAHVHDNNVTGGDYGIYLKVVGNSTVDSNNVSSSQAAGIYLDDSTTTSIVQNSISGSGWCGIYIEDSDPLVSGNVVTYNGYEGISLHSTFNANISGNQIVGNRDGIEVWYSASVRVEANSASSNARAGAFVGYSSDITLMGNNFSSNLMYGVCMEEQVSDIAVINNDLSSNGECGISSVCWPEETTGNITLAENTVDRNSETGIYLEYTDDVSICGNQVTNNGAGISVNYCDLSEIAENSVLSNTLDGIQLTYSNESTLSDNNCSSNNRWGIQIRDSSGTVMLRNQMWNNLQYGIYIYGMSSSNIVFNNTFVDNNGAGSAYDPAHIQAYDEGTGNWWNSSEGYGNYWSDWTTPDDVPRYGIVDIPYDIDGSAGAKDYYPLTAPQVPTEPIPEFPIILIPVLGSIFLMVLSRRKRKGI